MVVEVEIGAFDFAAHIEMIVVALKDAKRCGEEGLVISYVGAIHNAIGVFHQKAVRDSRYGRRFREARRYVGVEVRIPIEHLAQTGQVIIQIG